MFHDRNENLTNFFKTFINSEFEDHEDTTAWKKEVTDTDWKHRSDLIERGQCTFLEGVKGLTIRDLVVIYAYYYMEGHAVSLYHVLLNARKKHKISFLNNLIHVDFGCGPITAAIAMAVYNLKHGGKDKSKAGLTFHYIGIDQSDAMLSFGQEVQEAAGRLFNSKSTFEYINAEDANRELTTAIGKHRGFFGATICLNFSYYFASQTIDVPALVKLIKRILTEFAADKICLVFQNADNPNKNASWYQFKDYTKGVLFPVYADEAENVSYINVSGRRGQYVTIKLLHAVLVNQTFKDAMEELEE